MSGHVSGYCSVVIDDSYHMHCIDKERVCVRPIPVGDPRSDLHRRGPLGHSLGTVESIHSSTSSSFLPSTLLSFIVSYSPVYILPSLRSRRDIAMPAVKRPASSVGSAWSDDASRRVRFRQGTADYIPNPVAAHHQGGTTTGGASSQGEAGEEADETSVFRQRVSSTTLAQLHVHPSQSWAAAIGRS